MISRKTALSLAEVYTKAFYNLHKSYSSHNSSLRYSIEKDKLFDYLFINDYPAWFCNKSKKTSGWSETYKTATRELKEFIMKLHTGETQFDATLNWTWKQREQLGQEYLLNLATDILNKWHNDWKKASKYEKPEITTEIEILQKSLELDGYIYKNSTILSPESEILDKEEESGVLETLYDSLQLGNKEVAFHHLRLSEEHYIHNKWDDSIANSRKFLECVLTETAATFSLNIKKQSLSENVLNKPVQVRDFLEKEGLLEAKETSALSSVYGLLSETGSHPYMAQNDQARLLRHLSLTFSQFVMLRLQGRIKT